MYLKRYSNKINFVRLLRRQLAYERKWFSKCCCQDEDQHQNVCFSPCGEINTSSYQNDLAAIFAHGLTWVSTAALYQRRRRRHVHWRLKAPCPPPPPPPHWLLQSAGRLFVQFVLVLNVSLVQIASNPTLHFSGSLRYMPSAKLIRSTVSEKCIPHRDRERFGARLWCDLSFFVVVLSIWCCFERW